MRQCDDGEMSQSSPAVTSQAISKSKRETGNQAEDTVRQEL